MKDNILWTALITPMHSDGSIHFDDLEKMVHRQEKAGNGILLIGSTGEGLALTTEEKRSIVNFTSALKPEVPVMVGVGGFNLNEQSEWIGYCNPLGVDAFLLVTPLYAKPGAEGQAHWFLSLMDQAEKPCMIYNIPSRTGVKMPPEVLKKVEYHKNFWAVKEASGAPDEYKAFRESSPSVPLFSGDDGLMPVFAEIGCSGLVSVASNVWPEATRRYVEKCLSFETDELLPVWNDAVKALFSAPNPIPCKVLLKQKNLLETDAVRPPLTTKELKSEDQVIRADQAVANWYNSNK